MPVSLRRLIDLGEADVPVASAPSPVVASSNPPSGGQEYNVGLDFTNFEKTLANFTENSKNAFQNKLLSLVGNKKVFLRGSKGYGQPIKDYTINVKSVSIDFYYERYVVVFKDEDDKEYFLEPNYRIKILGTAQFMPKTVRRKKKVAEPTVPPVNPDVTPQGKQTKPSQVNPSNPKI
jgi:hypothetical protein